MKNNENRMDEDVDMYNYNHDVEMNVFKNNFDENEIRRNNVKDINDQNDDKFEFWESSWT
jgi:hypothetical protein